MKLYFFGVNIEYMENLVKFRRNISIDDFNKIETKDNNTIYFINDQPKIYLGDRLVAEGNDESFMIKAVKLTKDLYDALDTKDDNTLYIIIKS